ncbi:MAG: hypothetical protein KAH24_07995 [Holophagae bacterium]|nr:hypothetical protein [Holophagae bacterium]
MRKLGIAWLFLLTLVPATAEKSLLCGGILENRPVFLIAEGNDVFLKELDGKILFRENNVLAADMADRTGVVFLKENALVRLDETLHRHEEKISRLSPLLSLIQAPIHLALIQPGLLLIPAEVPILMSLNSGEKRPFPGAFQMAEGSFQFDGISAVWSLGKWIVCRKGEFLMVAAKDSLENRLTVSLQDSYVEDIWLEGKEIQILLQNGAGYRVDPLSKTSTSIPKKKRDGSLIRQHVRFWNDASDSIVELRLKDDGALSLLSAWKNGKMDAEISVRVPGSEPVIYGLSFSIKTLGKFQFSLRQVSGALILDFHEKDIVVTKENRTVRFVSIAANQPYVVAGGVVYSWDSSKVTAGRVKGDE